MMKIYKTQILEKKKKCVIFAYCRGKLYEGIDFKDDLARFILIVGIPYLPINDPLIK